MVSEKSVRDKCKRLVESSGGLLLPLRGWLNGTPDALMVIDGQLYLVEFKRPGGALSEVQKALHRKITKCGCSVLVVDDPEQIKTVIGG